MNLKINSWILAKPWSLEKKAVCGALDTKSTSTGLVQMLLPPVCVALGLRSTSDFMGIVRELVREDVIGSYHMESGCIGCQMIEPRSKYEQPQQEALLSDIPVETVYDRVVTAWIEASERTKRVRPLRGAGASETQMTTLTAAWRNQAFRSNWARALRIIEADPGMEASKINFSKFISAGKSGKPYAQIVCEQFAETAPGLSEAQHLLLYPDPTAIRSNWREVLGMHSEAHWASLMPSLRQELWAKLEEYEGGPI